MLSDLKPLDVVEVCITDKYQTKHYFKTKVENVLNKDTLYVLVPTNAAGRPVLFFGGITYSLYINSDKGILSWDILYVGTEMLGKVKVLKFRAISGPKTTQRREYFRQQISIDFTGEILDFSDEKKETAFKGRLLDLSGGGCSFMADPKLPPMTKVSVAFDFRDRNFDFTANVISAEDVSHISSAWYYRYRCQWFDPNPDSIETLIKLVFQEQRNSMSKQKSGLKH